MSKKIITGVGVDYPQLIYAQLGFIIKAKIDS